MPPLKWIKLALAIPDLKLVEITPEIACTSCALPGDFHKDPADQIIVATAREMGIALLTVDKKIVEYKYIHVWR